MKPPHEGIVPHTTTNFNLTPTNAEPKPICACQDCQTKANTNSTNNPVDQAYQPQNAAVQHNIVEPTSQAYQQNIQQTTKDIYSQCDIATKESQINLPLVEKLSAKPSTDGLKNASQNVNVPKNIIVNNDKKVIEMYTIDLNNMSNAQSNNTRDGRKPEIGVNTLITEETMQDCIIKSVLQNATPRDSCMPKDEFSLLKDDAVIQFGYIKPDDFKDSKFVGGLSEHQLMQNLVQKPYDYAANMTASNLEEVCCER